jgi:pimeloyl-ACP methyl ester carboxylesterase
LADLFAISDSQENISKHVIFLHGLGGHPYDTWRLSSDPDLLWPQWLAQDIQGLVVWTVGYEAAISRWRGAAMHLTDRATNVLERLIAERKLQCGEIILVGHSLGGLLIKQLLRTADSMSHRHAEIDDFIKRVRRVVFIGTPHFGSALASWGDRLRILIRPSLATASLVRNDGNLRELNQWYREWSGAQHIEHLILTETKDIRLCGLIVSPDSSDPGLFCRPIPIDADHITICKPTDRASEVYVHVRNFIIRPIELGGREKFIESTLNAQTAKLEILTDGIREQGQEIQTAISAQGYRTADIVVDHLNKNLRQIVSVAGRYPKDLVDKEIQNQILNIRRARFFRGFSVSEHSLRLGESILNGELAGGSDVVKSNALAWCARFLALRRHGDKSDEFLSRAKQMSDVPQIAIAEAFRISVTRSVEEALGKLASLGSPTARSAAFRIVSQHQKGASAIDWLAKSGLKQSDLDADGKLFLLTNLCELNRWDVAHDYVAEIQEDDFQNTPALFYMAAMCHLMQGIPDDLRSHLGGQVPFEASSFPLASTEASLKSRRKAEELFQKCALAAQELGCMEDANTAQDFALWLELRDPERHDSGRQKLEESMREPAHSLRRLHLALQFGLKIDLDSVEQEIEQQAAVSGGKSHVAAMARLAIAFTKKNPKEIVDYIDRHRNQLSEHLNKTSLNILEIEMLAKAGLPQRAEERLTELAPDGLPELQKNRLLRIIAESTGADPVEGRRVQFEKTGQSTDLVNLVALLEERSDWLQLCHYGALLFDRTKALPDAERLASALNQANRQGELLSLLKRYPDLVNQSDNLQMLWSWCLYREGLFAESKVVLEKLRSKRDHSSDRALVVNLAISSSAWEELLPYVEDEWRKAEHRQADELIRTALLAQIVESPRSKDFVSFAANKGINDPAILIGAYTIATKGGWENQPNVAQWLHRAAELSDDKGPIQKVSLKELVDRAPEWNRREADAWQNLYDGTLPIFGVARLLNRTLVDTFLLPALANPGEPDPRRRALIPAYSGGRAPLSCSFRVIGIDATALLTLGALGLLETVNKQFDTLYIPHSTLAWLFEEKQKIKFHQPSRIKDADALRGLLATGALKVLTRTTRLDPELVADVGDELASLIAEAVANENDDGRQRLVIRPSPVHRVNSLMEEEANLSRYFPYLCSCTAVVDKLMQQGHLTASEASHARSYLSLHEKKWPDQPAITDGAILYLDDLSVSYLQQTGVIAKLRSAGFDAYFSARKLDEVNALLRYEDLTLEVEKVIDSIKHYLEVGVKTGTIKAGPMPYFDERDDPTFERHPTIAIFHLAQHAEAIVVDDRFLNQHRIVENGSSQTPIFTTLDVLDVLHSSGNITFNQLLDCRTKLRRAGYLFVPVTGAELENHLNLAEVVDNRIVETAELKAIRESLLRIRMSSLLQLPREAIWLDGVMATLTHVLKAQWRTDMNESVARARSEWLLDMLDLRGWAHRLDAAGFKQIVERGHSAQLMSLLMSRRNTTSAVENKYLEWADECILKSLRDENPELYKSLVERTKELIARVVERKASE